MKGIFVVPVHKVSREEMINIDLHNIKENFDYICKDMIKSDFPCLDKYSFKYCVPTNQTSEMLSSIMYQTDDIIELVNRATLALVDPIKDIFKNDYIFLIFRVAESNDSITYNQKKQNELKKWLAEKYKISKYKIKIFNYS